MLYFSFLNKGFNIKFKLTFCPLPVNYKEIIVIGAHGHPYRVHINNTDTLADVRRYIKENFHQQQKFPNFLFEAESNGVCKAEEVNISDVTLIDKEIHMIWNTIEEVVLESVADVQLMEEEG